MVLILWQIQRQTNAILVPANPSCHCSGNNIWITIFFFLRMDRTGGWYRELQVILIWNWYWYRQNKIMSDRRCPSRTIHIVFSVFRCIFCEPTISLLTKNPAINPLLMRMAFISTRIPNVVCKGYQVPLCPDVLLAWCDKMQYMPPTMKLFLTAVAT